jgi:hypothetical protein
MLTTPDMPLKVIFPVIFCWLLGSAQAQNPDSCHCDSLLEQIMQPRFTGDLYIKPIPSSVSQFLTDEWLPGTICFSNDQIINSRYFRYNGYIDRLIWINEDYIQIRLDFDPIRSFCLFDKYIPDRSYCFEKIKIPKELGSDSILVFAQVLFKNTISLFVQRKVVLTGIEERKTDRAIINSYEKRNVYFFKSGDHLLRGFRKITKTNILNVFSGRKEEILTLFRSEKRFRLKTEEDLIRFAAHLNGKEVSNPRSRDLGARPNE